MVINGPSATVRVEIDNSSWEAPLKRVVVTRGRGKPVETATKTMLGDHTQSRVQVWAIQCVHVVWDNLNYSFNS